tara:strand:+ start:189 stop:416 length:228 start_codon:yes stop_codon:yes gene_type:complete
MRNYKNQIKEIIHQTAEGTISWKPWKTAELGFDSVLNLLDRMNIDLDDDNVLEAACVLYDECLAEVQTQYNVELS